MNMQQMMAQSIKMQRELQKAREALDQELFTVSKAGIVTVEMFGSCKIQSIKIDPSVMTEEDKEMVEETIALAINEILDTIALRHDEIEQKITGQGGLPF